MEQLTKWLEAKGKDINTLSEKELADAMQAMAKEREDAEKAAHAESDSAKDLAKKALEMVKSQGEDMKQLAEKTYSKLEKLEAKPVGVPTAPKSFGQELSEKLTKDFDQIKAAVVSGKSHRITMTTKAPTDPLFQEDGNGTITGQVPQAFRRPGFVDQRRRQPFVRDYLTVFNLTESNVVEWVEQQLIEETTGGTSEGSSKNDMSWEYIVRQEIAKTRTVTTAASTRMLNRIDAMRARINGELTRSILDDYDQQILFGDGTGNNLLGLFSIAPSFAAGTFAGAVPNANNFDVARVARVNIATAPSGTINGVAVAAGFNATEMFVNPVDAAEMDLAKGSNGQYVMPPFTNADGTVVAGCTVIESNHIPVGQYIMGDMAMAELYEYEGLTLDIGVINAQFKENMRTILAEHSALLVVPQNHYGAFVQGNFATDRAAITAP